MRNSSLVECICAENVTGLKHSTEAAGCGQGVKPEIAAVGEHSGNRRRETVRTPGGTGRAYADMSSDKIGEKPIRRKSKVSWVKVIFPGLVGS